MSKLSKELRGWDWIYSQMNECPYCGLKPSLNIAAIPFNREVKLWRVACMNICCSNFETFENESWGKAIVEWNKRFPKKENENDR